MSSVSAFSRIITLTRWPSCARSSDWASEIPRCESEVAAISTASQPTRKNTCASASAPVR
jgi:hypothetical protein